MTLAPGKKIGPVERGFSGTSSSPLPEVRLASLKTGDYTDVAVSWLLFAECAACRRKSGGATGLFRKLYETRKPRTVVVVRGL